MEKNIEGVLENLLSDNKNSNVLLELIKEVLNNHPETASNVTVENTKLKKKIDIVTSILPMLPPDNAEQAKFIIRILTIAKFISELN